jgi:hypothetical protein
MTEPAGTFTIRCSCGSEIVVSDEQRGGSVYCESCGREITVPESKPALEGATQTAGPIPASSAQPSRRRRTSSEPVEHPPARRAVFSDQSAASLALQVVAERACTHCGHRMPVRLRELGKPVRCPQCKKPASGPDEIKGLGSAPGSTADRARVEIVPCRSRSWWSLSRSLFAFATLVLVVLAGAAMTSTGPAADLWQMVWTVSPPPLLPPDPTGETELQDLPPDQAPQITLAAIEALLQQPDLGVALAEARWLLEQLQALQTSPDDPRLVRLNLLIADLEQRLAERNRPSGGADVVQEFRDLLQAIRVELKARNLEAARSAAVEAREFYVRFPDELGFLSRSFRQLEDAVLQLEFEMGGVERIEDQLNTALREARAGNVTEAIQARAEALQSARYATAVSPQDEEHLKELNREIDEPLRLAIGRRALTFAQELQDAGDREARDREILAGRAALEGLLSETISPLIKQLEEVSSNVIENPRASPRGGELAFLHAYESVIEQYGRGDLDQFVLPAVDAWEAAGDDAGRQQQVTEVVLNMAERTAHEVLREVDANPALVRSAAVVRAQLQRLAPWSWEDRLKALLQSLDQAIHEVATNELEAATAAAAEGDYARAARLLEIAVAANDEFVNRQAESLRADWERRASEQTSLKQLHQLADSGDIVAAAREAAIFLRDYADSAHRQEVEDLQRAIEPELAPAVTAALQGAEDHLRADRFLEFRELLTGLDGIPIPDASRAEYDRLVQEAQRLVSRADVLFRQAQEYQRMLSESDVLQLLERLPTVVALDPTHADAARLYQKAKQRGVDYATIRLRKAETQHRIRGSWEAGSLEMLRTVLKLDPEGESGKQAQRYLDEAS